jgi:ribosomal protein S18 acetylase RimI-like enzyme
VSGLRLRRYHARDAEPCRRIFEAAWQVARPDRPRQVGPDEFGRLILGERVTVAERGGEVVGFVALYAPEAFVHHLYVSPAWHGRGVGRALLAHAVAEAGGAASLKVMAANAGARAFYARLGWAETDRGEDEWGDWLLLTSPRDEPLDGAPV